MKDIDTDVGILKEWLRECIGTTYAEATSASEANLLNLDLSEWGGGEGGPGEPVTAPETSTRGGSGRWRCPESTTTASMYRTLLGACALGTPGSERGDLGLSVCRSQCSVRESRLNFPIFANFSRLGARLARRAPRAPAAAAPRKKKRWRAWGGPPGTTGNPSPPSPTL